MYVWYPIFNFLNGLLTHQFLTNKVSIYKELDYDTQHEVIGRWNNALVQVPLALAIFGWNSSATADYFAACIVTYLLTDVVHMLFYFYDWVYYAHHLIPVLVYYTIWDSFFIDTKVAFIFVIGLLELTTPPISLVWTLSKLKCKGWYYPYLSAFAYLNFTGIRILYFPYLWYNGIPPAVKILSFPYHILNVYWFGKMTSYVLKSTR